MVMLVNYAICSASWIVYGAKTGSGFVIWSNIIGLSASGVSIIQKYKYDKRSSVQSLDKNLFTKQYKSILCLDGALPPSSFFKDIKLPIIAADGAANSLINTGIEPELIIGDLDSINEKLIKKRTILKIPDQNTTDFEKAIDYIAQNNLSPPIILGINGGYIDHILNNINLFSSINAMCYSEDIIGFTVQDKIELDLLVGTKLSIFGFPNCCLSTNGLKWELENSTLTFPGVTSCFNRSVSNKVEITVHSGKALVFIYKTPINDAGIH
jgi:thiamine pyrophosphokinase